MAFVTLDFRLTIQPPLSDSGSRYYEVLPRLPPPHIPPVNSGPFRKLPQPDQSPIGLDLQTRSAASIHRSLPRPRDGMGETAPHT